MGTSESSQQREFDTDSPGEKEEDSHSASSRRRIESFGLTSERVTTPWLTTSEAAAYLRVRPRTLLQWVRQGKLRAHVLSGTKRRTWRFRQADLDAVLVDATVLPSHTPSVCPAERMEQ